jgi:hypothetical protein
VTYLLAASRDLHGPSLTNVHSSEWSHPRGGLAQMQFQIVYRLFGKRGDTSGGVRAWAISKMRALSRNTVRNPGLECRAMFPL